MNMHGASTLGLLTVLISLLSSAGCQDITDSLTSLDDGKTHTFDVSGAPLGSTIRVKFVILNPATLTSTSLIVNDDAEIPVNSISRDDFYQENPLKEYNYDLDAMWDIRDTHYINIEKESGHNTLYLTVFKFDPAHRRYGVNYQIYITFAPGYQCEPCANGESFNQKCVCRNCLSGSSGKTCSRRVQAIEENITTIIQHGQQYFYSLPEFQKVQIDLSVKGCFAESYIQFKDFDGEAATFYNVIKSKTAIGHYTMGNTGISVQATTSGKKALITVICVLAGPGEFSLKFYPVQGVNILIIVMGVLGGLILVGLIIAAICIIKRSRANAARVRSQMELPSNSNKLSANEIERFFPPVIFKDMKQDAMAAGEVSMNQMNKEQEVGTQEDCVICLQAIKEEEEVRIGYCKHIFHSNCLISWFNKQRNCPYCRKEYNRDVTQKEFQTLVERHGHKNLQGRELAHAIHFTKPSSQQTIVQDLE